VDNLQNDNIYPTQSHGYFTMTANKTVKKSLEAEIRQTLDQLPVLKQVVKHLDEQIAYLDSIDSLDADLTDPQAHVNQIKANQLAKAKLQVERSYILARVERAKR
jgi:uncharacterized membrane protein YccC